MATPEETYYKALKFAVTAHGPQLDLDSLPYILHPARVAEHFVIRGQWELAVAAVLHDTVEDTDTTMLDIGSEFGPRVMQLVDAVSRRSYETYAEFIDRCSKDAEASLIKLADIRDNMYRRGPVVSGMEKRYLKAIATLTKAHAITYVKCPCCEE